MKSILIALILAVPAALHAQTTVTGNLKYLGQPGPGTAPVKFAPGLVSQDSVHEFGSVFSSDGNEFYYGVDVEGRTEIRFMSIVKGQWTKPERLLFHNQYSYNDPMLSPDEKRLYFISDQPLESSDGKKDYDIWYVDRIHDGWSSPRNAGPSINSNGNEYYMSFSNYGTMYFSSNKASKD